ncbi:DoxX family protein [Nonomuraea sp. NPDC059194]|uniref:DoxX family protein n=1 Tax=Nonomuraea sp. NPDC059194 TaxID=3346764 RepID=UPI0036B8C97C
MTASTRAEPSTGRRIANVGLWVLQVVVAAGFLLAAMGKFTGAEPSVSTFAAIGLGDWFRYLVGLLEVAGVVGLLVPRLAGAAALALSGLMVGASLTQLIVVGSGLALPIMMLALSLVIAWGRWSSTARLWAALTRR